MGTNFYVNTKNHEYLHIGKRSCGWYFTLHIYPDKGINELIDWVKEFRGGEISDEYGRQITVDEMIKIIINKYDENWFEEEQKHEYGSPAPDNGCVYGKNSLKRVEKLKEGAFGLYSLEEHDFC